MDAPPQDPSRKAASRRLKTFDEDDIVRYSPGLDVPVVGLVRDRHEYKEMREIALIYGLRLSFGKKTERTDP